MLTKGTPWKNILIFAIPLMLANILQQLYNTADTIIVGNFISQNALASVGSCTYIVGLYTGISIALALGTGVVVSQAYGAKDFAKLKCSVGTGSILLMLVGLAFAIFSFCSCEYILKNIVAVPLEILNQSVLYAKIYSIGLFFQFSYNVFASILRAVGNSKSSLYFLIITTIINIVLDLIFVLIFKFGVGGVAVATCISQFCAMLISFLYMIKAFPQFRPKWVYKKELSIDILKTGIPLTIQALIVNVGFMFMQNIANSFGVDMTASYAVSCRLEIYMLTPIISILHAISTYAGQNFGAGNYKKLLVGIKQSVIMNLVIATFIGILFFVLAPQLISLFALKNQSYLYALAHTRLAAIDLLLYASYTPVNGLCIGIGKGYVLSLISLVELTGRVFFAILLSGIIGAPCVWWSEPFAWIIVATGVYIFYFMHLKKQLRIKNI